MSVCEWRGGEATLRLQDSMLLINQILYIRFLCCACLHLLHSLENGLLVFKIAIFFIHTSKSPRQNAGMILCVRNKFRNVASPLFSYSGIINPS